MSPIAISTERAFSPQSTVILDCGSVNFIDSQGAEMEVLAADGVLDLFGAGRVHAKTYLAVQANQEEGAPAHPHPDA